MNTAVALSTQEEDILRQYDVLVENLKSFISLKTLTIIELNGSGKSSSRYDYIVDQFPSSLESLELIATCLSPLRRGISRAITARQQVPAASTTINLFLPNSNIKSLDITENCELEEESLNYIMQKFQGLKKLKLDMNKLLANEEVMVNLFRYASGISQYTLNGYVKRGTSEEEEESTAIHINAWVGFTFSYDSVAARGPIQSRSLSNQATGNEKVLNVDVGFTLGTNEIVEARTSFFEEFSVRLSSSLRQLSVSVCAPLFRSGFIDSGFPSNLYTVKDLEDSVLKYCDSSCHLELDWMELQNGDANDGQIGRRSIINENLIMLKLSHSWIDPKAFFKLVSRFPNLEDVWIEGCIFLDASDNNLHNKPAQIIMPDTQIDTLRLHWSGEEYTGGYQYSKLHLKVFIKSSNSNSRRRKILYYGLEEMEMKLITAHQCSVDLQLGDCISYEISCEDLLTIRIKFDYLCREIKPLKLKKE